MLKFETQRVRGSIHINSLKYNSFPKIYLNFQSTSLVWKWKAACLSQETLCHFLIQWGLQYQEEKQLFLWWFGTSAFTWLERAQVSDGALTGFKVGFHSLNTEAEASWVLIPAQIWVRSMLPLVQGTDPQPTSLWGCGHMTHLLQSYLLWILLLGKRTLVSRAATWRELSTMGAITAPCLYVTREPLISPLHWETATLRWSWFKV